MAKLPGKLFSSSRLMDSVIVWVKKRIKRFAFCNRHKSTFIRTIVYLEIFMAQKNRIWNEFKWNRVSPELRAATLAQYKFVTGAENLNTADIIFGNPDPATLKSATELQWIQLTSAGHSQYDDDDVKVLFQERGITMTNSSAVYAEPCAEHLFAMILGLTRRLPQAMENQSGAKQWNHQEERKRSFLLKNQKVLLLGFGAIARRLTELLHPFDMQIAALRRHSGQEKNVTIISQDKLAKVLSEADHIVDILPENGSTKNFVDEAFLAGAKAGANFYNIGRGTTVDQNALMASLRGGRLAAAYLDVTSPEPLPPNHPLWTTPNCYITPHSGGGHRDEFDRLLRHFLDNLKRFENDEELSDRII
jgi:phosphoglycerate dehydrogenase-like enzyme